VEDILKQLAFRLSIGGMTFTSYCEEYQWSETDLESYKYWRDCAIMAIAADEYLTESEIEDLEY